MTKYAWKLTQQWIASGVHRTGAQFYDLYEAYVGPGLAYWALVLYWYLVYADERQRQTGRGPE